MQLLSEFRYFESPDRFLVPRNCTILVCFYPLAAASATSQRGTRHSCAPFVRVPDAIRGLALWLLCDKNKQKLHKVKERGKRIKIQKKKKKTILKHK